MINVELWFYPIEDKDAVQIKTKLPKIPNVGDEVIIHSDGGKSYTVGRIGYEIGGDDVFTLVVLYLEN
tara:strand:+ start:9628 stop:9831 length:204 start_codon:yes stop_codon:yes gene_type:complete